MICARTKFSGYAADGRRCYHFGGGGGSSKSEANQSTTTTNTDMRVVGGTGSGPTFSANNSTVAVTMTDAGAVHDAFGFASSVTQGAFDFASASQHASQATVDQAMTQVASAYSTAKAGEQQIFAGAALAIVGVVAAIAFKSKG